MGVIITISFHFISIFHRNESKRSGEGLNQNGVPIDFAKIVAVLKNGKPVKTLANAHISLKPLIKYLADRSPILTDYVVDEIKKFNGNNYKNSYLFNSIKESSNILLNFL